MSILGPHDASPCLRCYNVNDKIARLARPCLQDRDGTHGTEADTKEVGKRTEGRAGRRTLIKDRIFNHRLPLGSLITT